MIYTVLRIVRDLLSLEEPHQPPRSRVAQLTVEHPSFPAQELHGVDPRPGFGRGDLLARAVVVFLGEPVEGVVQGLRGADLEFPERGEVGVSGVGFLGREEMGDADA